MILPVTSLLAGIFALLMVPFSLQVSMRRVTLGGVSSCDFSGQRVSARGSRSALKPMRKSGLLPAWEV